MRREARAVLGHPVIDPTVHATPLDPLGIVVFALLFCVAAGLARVRPAACIALLIACVPFSLSRDIGPTTITLEKVALLGSILGLFSHGPGLTALRSPTARTIAIAGSVVVAATALSIAHATYRGAAFRESFKAIEYVMLFATVVVAARADIALRGVALAIYGTVIVVSALALAQEFTGAPSGMWFHDRPIPRIAGPLEGPNQLAGYLGIAVCFLLAAIAVPAGPEERRRPRLARLALGLGLAAEVLTISRAGLASAAAGLATVIALAPGRLGRRDALTIAGSVAIGLAVIALWGLGAAHLSLAGFALLGHFSSLAESRHAGSVGTRSQLYTAALALWRMHPIFGIGAGNFERELGLVGFPELHTHANSLYVQALVEGGIPLLLATLGLGVVSIAVFARGPFGDPFVLAALAASVGFALHQIGDLLVFFPKVGDLWWILLALGAARRDAARPRA